jgi:hypothetical protein
VGHSASTLKPVTVRLPEEDLVRLKDEADELGVSLAVLLRIMVRQQLRATPHMGGLRRANALRSASLHFAGKAETSGYAEEDAVAMSRAARKRLAESR